MHVARADKPGTFAFASDASVSGHAFKVSLMKNLAPILYDADKSVLYLLPLLNVHCEKLSLSLFTRPEPSKAYFDVPAAQTVEKRISLL